MKSICIKVNNKLSINYLLEKINNIQLNDVYFSCKKFKNYQNIIIHFKGQDIDLFLKNIADILSSIVVDLYEPIIIRQLIKSEYFYFNDFEKKQIENSTICDLYDNDEVLYNYTERKNLIYNAFLNYLSLNHSIVLKGFITFRIKKYLEELLEQIDKSVNKYIVEREYVEFISLLKIYINSEPSCCDIVHLVYNNYKPTLLDENKTIISVDTDVFNAKYLSDISFSSNDYTLNTLLNLIPKKIYIHLVNSNIDEFINTLKLIFEERICFCTDCSICKTYI